MKQKSGSKKPKVKVIRTKRTVAKAPRNKPWPRCLLPGNARPTFGKGNDYEIQIARKQWSPGVRSGLGTTTFGEDWGATKDVATKSPRPIAKPAEAASCLYNATKQ